MNELELAREEINKVDAEMAELFVRRMRSCEKVAAYKKEHGLSIRDLQREASLIERCRKMIGDEEIESYYVTFLKNMIDISCRYQSKLNSGMKVAYSGVEGAYAHIASMRMFPESSTESYPDFTAAYNAVEKGEADCAVLPIENSYAGEVGNVMDLLFSGDLYVNKVIDLPIRHSIMSVSGATPDTVKKVISHPQALRQCSKYISEHGYEVEEFSNTAAAAKYVKECNDPTLAAIASEETANIFGLEIIKEGINDAGNNTTRFASLSRVPNAAANRRDGENFILVFTVQNRAGSLAQTLNIIGAHGFNMRSLRSRPMKELQWNYYFYIEVEGNIHNENGQNMLRELSAVCARLKLVGTFTTEEKH